MTVIAQSLHGLAIVAGAGSGIGRATAIALAAAGCDVVLTGRQEAPLRRVASELSRPATVVVADLTSEAGVAAVAGSCRQSVDILVHSAGLFHFGSVADTPADTLEKIYAVNYHAPLMLTAACLSTLQSRRGQVVFINSTAGLASATGDGAYAASKHALRVATDTMRNELTGSGVRVLSVYPGRTKTPMQNQVLSAEGRPDARIPMLLPEHVAAAVVASLQMPRRAEVTDIVIRPSNTPSVSTLVSSISREATERL